MLYPLPVWLTIKEVIFLSVGRFLFHYLETSYSCMKGESQLITCENNMNEFREIRYQKRIKSSS